MPIINPQFNEEKERIRETIREVLREELSDFIGFRKYLFQDDIQIFNGRNIQVGKGTGTKIGTAADQKIGLYGATPVVQAGAIGDASGTDAAIIDAIRDAIKNIGITA